MRDTFPSGTGQETTTPVVVVFNESLAADSLAETDPVMGPGGIPIPGVGGVFVRDTTTSTPLPGTLDLIYGGRAVLLLPTGLMASTEYEIVVAARVSDVDGIPISNGEVSAGFFTTNATPDPDPQVVGTLPMDNDDNVPVGADVYVFFDRAADAMTVNAANLVLSRGGVTEPAAVTTPIMALTGADTRVALISPAAPVLDPGARYQLDLSTDIQFGAVALVTGGASPFSEFDTSTLSSPLDLRVVGAPAEFPLAITGPLLASLMIEVDVAGSVPAGATVRVRIYGGDPRTETDDEDLRFFEASAAVPTAGPVSVAVPFGDMLGSIGATALDEGSLTVQATVEQGSRDSGFVGGVDNGSLDTSAPELLEFLPNAGMLGTDLVTDQGRLLVFGRASEQIGAAELVVDGVAMPVGLFASSPDGRFVMEPLTLVRQTDPVSFTFNLTDTSGNVSSTALSGEVSQRGLVTGSMSGGEIVIEVYDDSTLSVIPDADVVVVTSTGVELVSTTNAAGRVSFVGLPSGTVSVTATAPDFDLVSLLETSAGFCSLPLRPTGLANASADLRATVAFLPNGTTTARLGTNLPVDPFESTVSTDVSSPNMVRTVAVRSARPFATTALSGNFVSPTSPFFSNFACELCGLDGLTRSPGTAPAEVGDTVTAILPTSTPTGTTSITVAAPPVVDFSLATGLGSILDVPRVDVVAAYDGFPGSSLVGAGLATRGSGSRFTVNAAYFPSSFGVLSALGPVLMLSTDAVDAAGARSRVRQVILSALDGAPLLGIDPLGIVALSPPMTAGEPSVVASDVIDPSMTLGGVGLLEVTAVDSAGRAWRIYRQDLDGIGGSDLLELPDLPNLPGGGIVGLAAGAWTVTADAIVFIDLLGGPANFLFEDRLRVELGRSRGLPFTLTVN